MNPDSTDQPAKGPLRDIVEVVSDDGVFRVERLSCGHRVTRAASGRGAYRRRCPECPPTAGPDPSDPRALYRVEVRDRKARKPWLVVACTPDGESRVVSAHISAQAAQGAASRCGNARVMRAYKRDLFGMAATAVEDGTLMARPDAITPEQAKAVEDEVAASFRVRARVRVRAAARGKAEGSHAG